MLMVSIALVMAVIVTNIFLRKDSGKRVPTFFRKLLLRKLTRKAMTNKINHSENHVMETKLHDLELDVISNHSENDALSCRGRCSRRSRTNSYRPSMANGGGEHIDIQDRRELEWQMLAKVIDRMFFWLFLFSSIGILTGMFAQIPTFVST